MAIMAADVQETPFVKQLAASDRPTREKAFTSLQNYLLSGRQFSQLDLLKIWRGLYFCMFHTANPLPQQRLSRAYASLLLSLSDELFVPFVAAFFQTMIDFWPSMPSLRLDKYLFLIRLYISHSFIFLSKHKWKTPLLDDWILMIMGPQHTKVNGADTAAENGSGTSGTLNHVLDPDDKKVGDGLRYHVLDVWMDGLVEAEDWKLGLDWGLLRPLQDVAQRGGTKTLRQRGQAVLDDPRLLGPYVESAKQGEQDADEFEGFD